MSTRQIFYLTIIAIVAIIWFFTRDKKKKNEYDSPVNRLLGWMDRIGDFFARIFSIIGALIAALIFEIMN